MRGGLQETGTEELGDELKLVGGKAEQEAAGLKLYGILNTRNQRGYKRVAHGRSPVGENTYQFSDLGIIISDRAAEFTTEDGEGSRTRRRARRSAEEAMDVEVLKVRSSATLFCKRGSIR